MHFPALTIRHANPCELGVARFDSCFANRCVKFFFRYALDDCFVDQAQCGVKIAKPGDSALCRLGIGDVDQYRHQVLPSLQRNGACAHAHIPNASILALLAGFHHGTFREQHLLQIDIDL